eukprot:gene1092-436_t
MAANQNSRGGGNTASGFGGLGQSPFFNQSLGGSLTVDNLSGPLLFTPVPLSASVEPAEDQGTAGFHEPQVSQPVELTSQPAIFQPAVPTQDVPEQQDSYNAFAPAPFQQAPSSTQPIMSDGNPYMASPAYQTSTQPQQTSLHAYSDPYVASPGMQYMEMPFDGQIPTQLETNITNQTSTSRMSRPMQAVSPQPQQTSSRPQFYSPSGQPIYTFAYHPVQPHWFYYNNESTWLPFSHVDSRNLESVFVSKTKAVVPTHGGRYDVDLDSFKREAVYWTEAKTNVRRCTWFYRGESEVKLIPYEENISELLESEYKLISENGLWSKKVDLPCGDTVIFHNANVIVHYKHTVEPIDWTGEDSKARPRVVRRGIGDIADDIVEGEPDEIDHLIFVVHGIGPAADIKMRSIIDCVDDMRQQSLVQMGTHQFVKEGIPVGRVEYLPIEWYSKLHNDRHGVDDRLKAITLPSIGKFRNFTNETLTDILFFTSPMYCQAICDTVVDEMNRLLQLFQGRNPKFQGQVSVCGHSLGACIVFDILANQANQPRKNSLDEVVEEIVDGKDGAESETEDEPVRPPDPPPVLSKSLSEVFAATVQEDAIPDIDDVLKKLSLTDLSAKFHEERVDTETLLMCSEADIKDLGILMGPRKKLMGFIREQAQIQEKAKLQQIKPEPQLLKISSADSSFVTAAAKKSQIAKRGVAGTGQPTVLYSKLDFNPAHFFALGSPIGLFTTVRGVSSFGLNFKLPTCPSVFNIFHPYDPVAYRIEPLVNPLRENLTRVGENLKQSFIEAVRSTWTTINNFARSHRNDPRLELAKRDETAVIQQCRVNLIILKKQTNLVKWMMYWIVFAFFTALENAADILVS